MFSLRAKRKKHPHRSRNMAIDDLRAREWVLIPGTLCTEEVFADFLDELKIPSNRRRAIRLKYPSVENYRDLLLSSSKEAIVCGFSLGSIVAAHHAHLLESARLILFGLNPYPDHPSKEEGRRHLEKSVGEHGGAGALAEILPTQEGPDPQRARSKILSMANSSARDISAQTILALTRPGAMASLSRSQLPVFALTGSNDTMAPEAQGMAAADAAPNGRFKSLPGLGHYALLENPKLCADCLIELEDC